VCFCQRVAWSPELADRVLAGLKAMAEDSTQSSLRLGALQVVKALASVAALQPQQGEMTRVVSALLGDGQPNVRLLASQVSDILRERDSA
jgi:hypothetical protein